MTNGKDQHCAEVMAARPPGASGGQPIEIRRGEQTIFIDPKEAFGDGSHPSTRLALRLMDELFSREGDGRGIASRRALDAGCGTGVLALAAAALWDLKVLAVDIAPDAIATAAENIERNPTPGLNVSLVLGELSCARGPFDLVLANLAPSVHVRAKSDLWGVVAPGGWIVVSGFFKAQKSMVLSFYVQKGASEEAFLVDDGWAAGLLRKPSRSTC
jgi:ribosomal protein L11 methyltransferase